MVGEEGGSTTEHRTDWCRDLAIGRGGVGGNDGSPRIASDGGEDERTGSVGNGKSDREGESEEVLRICARRRNGFSSTPFGSSTAHA